MNLAMDLALFHISHNCVICGGENSTNGCHLAVFSEDVVFARHFVATHLPPPSYPVGVLMVLTVKNYLKWWAIQLVIHSIVGG